MFFTYLFFAITYTAGSVVFWQIRKRSNEKILRLICFLGLGVNLFGVGLNILFMIKYFLEK